MATVVACSKVMSFAALTAPVHDDLQSASAVVAHRPPGLAVCVSLAPYIAEFASHSSRHGRPADSLFPTPGGHGEFELEAHSHLATHALISRMRIDQDLGEATRAESPYTIARSISCARGDVDTMRLRRFIQRVKHLGQSSHCRTMDPVSRDSALSKADRMQQQGSRGSRCRRPQNPCLGSTRAV
jgi:hypothetical protein